MLTGSRSAAGRRIACAWHRCDGRGVPLPQRCCGMATAQDAARNGALTAPSRPSAAPVVRQQCPITVASLFAAPCNYRSGFRVDLFGEARSGSDTKRRLAGGVRIEIPPGAPTAYARRLRSFSERQCHEKTSVLHRSGAAAG
jgi:hypothetical protein